MNGEFAAITALGQMDSPFHLATDGAGTVFVTEHHGHRVQAFTVA